MTEQEYWKVIHGLIARIPSGKVATFGMLATLAGNPKAARRAAKAVANGHGLPCHRVIRSSGELVPGYVFGQGEQRALLMAEGVMFTADGRVRLDQYIWKPSEELPKT